MQNSPHEMIINITVQLVRVKERNHPENEGVRIELVEAMKAKYANIDIDREIDVWLGVTTT